MVDNVHRVADKVIHPIAVVKSGEFAASPERFNGDPDEREDYDEHGNRTSGFASSIVPTLEEKTIFERRPSASHANGAPLFDLIEEGEAGTGGENAGPKEATVPGEVKHKDTVLDEDPKASKSGVPRVRGDPQDQEPYGAPSNAVKNDDAIPNKDIERDEHTEDEKAAIAARKTLRKHLSAKVGVSPWSMPTPTPKINPNRFHDPLDDTFWKDMWVATAVHNTEIFRKVFRCIPDDLVTTWAAYKAFANHAEKFNRTPEDVTQPGQDEPVKVVHDGPGTHGAGGGGSGGGAVGQGEGSDHKGKVEHKAPGSPKSQASTKVDDAGVNAAGANGGGHTREPSGPNDAWQQWERDDMEALLNEVRGHLGEPRQVAIGIWANGSSLLYAIPRTGRYRRAIPVPG